MRSEIDGTPQIAQSQMAGVTFDTDMPLDGLLESQRAHHRCDYAALH